MRPIELTNAVARELAQLHGSAPKADAFRKRARMADRPDDGGTVRERVLVLNDLHIGVGLDPTSGRFYPGDDFTAQQTQELISFLAREWQCAATGNDSAMHPTRVAAAKAFTNLTWANGRDVKSDQIARLQGDGAYKLTMCLNGDIFDFLQTAVERPGLPYPDGLTKDGKGPRNTPANTMVQLNMMHEGHAEVFRTLAVHLRLGHKIDYIPGNHDRHMYNTHVWSGQFKLPSGREVLGFTKIIEKELGAMGASAQEIKDALGRLKLRPMAFYADKMVEHGDMGDSANRVRRPYGEALASSGLHQDMPMALGDYGVRSGFNDLELADPTLDAIDNKMLFAKSALRHPIKAARLVWGFLKAAKQDGFEKNGGSQETDAAQRLRDISGLVDRFPEMVDQLNALRGPGEQLSKDEVVAGLTEIEKRSATPFFSNFRKGSLFVERMFKLALRGIFGGNDGRSKEQVYLERLDAGHKAFGMNDVICGHTHEAADTRYVNDQEKELRYVNTHTWMDKEGDWGRPTITWKQDGRGVGVIMIGTDDQGKVWSYLGLQKVVNSQGDLVHGDLLDNPDGIRKKKDKTAREIFATNHAATPA